MSRSLEVMIVEDERLISIMLCRMVEKLGHHVCACAASAADALGYLEHDRPDIAFLDIHLEGEEDGISIGKALHERHHVPFAYATAYADPETRSRAMETSPVAFMAKPVDIESLRKACNNIINT
jgi:DNA-binding NtrC family response regulator